MSLSCVWSCIVYTSLNFSIVQNYKIYVDTNIVGLNVYHVSEVTPKNFNKYLVLKYLLTNKYQLYNQDILEYLQKKII